jgi:N-acetylmuramoyl-L-alanine amidase
LIGSALRYALRPSPNHDERKDGQSPSILLLHYTGMASAAAAMERLCNPDSKVSCHYLIEEDGRITQLVDESRRAWHAGAGSWRGASDVNSMSIGIEIQNVGHNGDYPDFTPAQMEAVAALGKDIIARHGIRPERVLAHSDTAPSRKTDPGEKFDWRLLHEAGVGHWVPPASRHAGLTLCPGDQNPRVSDFQRALAHYGYAIATSGVYDVQTTDAVTAFQRHFRQELVDGIADASTVETLYRLTAALPLIPHGIV